MLRRSGLMISLILVTIFGLAQNSIIDSLKTELSKATADSSLVQLSIDLAFQWRMTKPDSADMLCQQVIALTPKLKDLKVKTRIFRRIGMIYAAMGDSEQAIAHYEEALKGLELLNNKAGQAELLMALSFITENQQGQLEKALNYRQSALRLRQELGDKVNEALIQSIIGESYRNMGDHASSLSALQQALEIVEATGNINAKATILNRFGVLYSALNNPKKAVEYYQQALQFYEETDNKRGKALVLNNIGTYQKNHGNYQDALSNLFAALAIRKEVGPPSAIFLPLYNIGNTYKISGNLDSAQYYLEKSLDLARKIEMIRDQALTLNELGSLHWQRKEIPKAIASLEEAFALTPPNAFKQGKVPISRLLYQIYKEQNRPTEALKYLEINQTLQDSIFNVENTRAITLLEANYQFEQEKQALAFQQEQELQRQRSFQIAIIAALLVALIFIIVITRYYRLKRRANEELTQLNQKILGQNEQLEQLNQVKSRFFTNISHEFRTPAYGYWRNGAANKKCSPTMAGQRSADD